MIDLIRVPTLHALSRQQLTAISLAAEGWSPAEGARMMGVEYSTYMHHVAIGSSRIVGDLPQMAKGIVWYRGATADVLGLNASRPTRQASLKRAYTIHGGQVCLHCGNVVHDDRQPEGRGDI